jgi:hypothetical protein
MCSALTWLKASKLECHNSSRYHFESCRTKPSVTVVSRQAAVRAFLAVTFSLRKNVTTKQCVEI